MELFVLDVGLCLLFFPAWLGGFGVDWRLRRSEKVCWKIILLEHCAGEREELSNTSDLDTVYLRECGETVATYEGGYKLFGSSPRVRGADVCGMFDDWFKGASPRVRGNWGSQTGGQT